MHHVQLCMAPAVALTLTLEHLFPLDCVVRLLLWLQEKEFYDVRFKVEPYLPYVSQNFMSLFALAFNTL